MLTEIINTEKDYIADVKLMLSVFRVPLEQSGILSKTESWTLFGNIQDLVKINESFLQKMSVRQTQTIQEGKTSNEMVIGDLFSEMVRVSFF